MLIHVIWALAIYPTWCVVDWSWNSPAFWGLCQYGCAEFRVTGDTSAEMTLSVGIVAMCQRHFGSLFRWLNPHRLWLFFFRMFSILWSIYVNYERDKHAMFLGLFAGRLPGVVYIIPDLVEGSWRENKSSDLWFLVTPVSMCFHDYPLVI